MATALTFAVRRRREPSLVAPAAPTPRETKRLSDTDDQDVLHMHVPFVFFYRGAEVSDWDPAAVIRRAVGKALVPYYPLAGRVREVAGRKLVVDCTGEDVLFVEADADVRVVEMEKAGLRPPFSRVDQQLLLDVDGSGGVLNSPLLLIQVSRLLCGGFVFAVRPNHTMMDATGLAQFLSAVAEHARGLPAPTTAPAWCRELFQACTPPTPTFPHREFDVALPVPPPPGEMVMRTFTFSPADVAAIMNHLPPNRRATATSFETMAAALWRARVAALELPPADELRLVVIVNFRTRAPELALPAGYCGNACAFQAVVTTAGSLLEGSLGDAVDLVRDAELVGSDCVRSVLDLLVLRGRPCIALKKYVVSDVRHAGFQRVDFGWAEPVYGGPMETLFSVSYHVAVRDGGEDAVAVPVVLPRPAMDRFTSEIEMSKS